MKVIKKINNNIAIAVDGENNEVIVFAKGIGYGNIPYEIKDLSVIERTFYDVDNRYYGLLKEIPNNIFNLVTKMVDVAKKNIEDELSPNLVFILADHINFAIQRNNEGIEMRNPLQWEIKHLYPKEYSIGNNSLDIIEKELGIRLHKNEAAFIALHFINAQLGKHDMTETTKITSIMGEILNLIKYKFKIEFDEDSFEFTRFVTHIRYFIMRQVNNKPLENENSDMFTLMQDKLTEELECVEMIEKHLNKNYGWKCTNDEKLYLMLHIQRIRKQNN